MAKRDTHDDRYIKAIGALRIARNKAGITQVELAATLGKRQQFVSKYESGERRLDIIEFLDVAMAIGIDGGALLRQLSSDL